MKGSSNGTSVNGKPVKEQELRSGDEIEIAAVAARLRAHPDAGDVEVLGRPDPEWGQEVVAFLSEYHELPRDVFLPHLFTHDDTAAAHHLFRVAAGLDSIPGGGGEILVQRVRDLVAKKKAVFAVGLEDRSLIKYHKLCEVVRNGPTEWNESEVGLRFLYDLESQRQGVVRQIYSSP